MQKNLSVGLVVRKKLSTGGFMDGYWCVVCCKFLFADELGVIVHDDVEHPDDMSFDEEDKPQ